MRWLTVLVVCCTLTACTTGNEPSATPAPPTASVAPSESPTVSSPPEPAEGGPENSPAIPVECDSDARAGIENTITSQLGAFARSDFAGARKFATRGFQSSIGEEAFQAIIEGQFAFLLEEPAVEFRACEQIDSLAQILVGIGTADPVTLRYRLVQEPDGWRIDGATIVGSEQELAA